MMLEKKVSVIIPIYNSEKTIKYCINSVQKQTFKDIEIIIVNDGSTDNSLNIVNEIALDDSRITIINKKNGGVSSARNSGINYATGKYLFFLDSDDHIDSDLLCAIYKVGITNNADLVCCNLVEQNNTKFMKFDQLSCHIIAKSTEEIGKCIYNMYLGSSCGKLFKAEIIKNNNILFKEIMSIGEDMEFVHQYLCHVGIVAGVPEVNYYIENINPTSLSKRYAHNMKATLETYSDTLKRVFKYYPEYEIAYYSKHMDIELEKCILFVNNLFLQGTPYRWKEKINEIKSYLIEDKHVNAFYYVATGKGPKNKLNQIYFYIFRTKKPAIIGFLFYFKEKLRKIIWMRGKKNVHC
ncbi:glycosyltransferase family 2 protein [Neobacillus soli]|uniref:glycosyltransferase family 2 protein n=1 Tax=Neobacillus soli TaxID=220688 RepID=UPI0008247018|nr:glycosyltransferase family 2 protein [Neobacillus soli]